MSKTVYITAQDRHRLMDCIAVLQESRDKRDLPYVERLEEEVMGAQVITDLLQVPRDVITMRSKARLVDLAGEISMECTLVYPSERGPERGYVSVLAPLGAAMLGRKVGDTFDVSLPKGPTQFRVEEILYQPEAAGDHHL